MELTQFVIGIISFAIVLGGTFVGIGWFVGKKIIELKDSQHNSTVAAVKEMSSLNTNISTVSTQMGQLSKEVGALSTQIHETNLAMKETAKQVHDHEARLSVVEHVVREVAS
jgi:predicted  nucleic acid-binding Zn-ribbon protein